MVSYLFSTAFSLYFIFASTFFITINGIFSEQFAETMTMRIDKTTHLHFYFHEMVSGEKPTAEIIFGRKNSVGMTVVINDPLTEGTEHGSKVVGRAQGIYASPTENENVLFMVVTFAFMEGKYNGSTVTIAGRNPVLEVVSEMPVVGGSGTFRNSRGYALAKTVKYNPKTGDAVVEYDVYVMHS